MTTARSRGNPRANSDGAGSARRATAARPAELANVAPAPLVAFDPAGAASVISYQVPEPTSYTGKHVLSLDYPLDTFAGLIPASQPGQQHVDAGQPQAAVAAGGLASAVVLPRQVVATDPADATNPPVILLAPFPRADRLSKLKWADVAAVAAAGKRVEVFRSVGGQLDYRIRAVADPTSPTGAVAELTRAKMIANFNPNPPDPDPDPGTNRAWLTVSITSPDLASPVLAGPWNGIGLTVSGAYVAYRTVMTKLTVTVKDAAGTVVGARDASWNVSAKTWSTDPQQPIQLVKSGSYTVYAHADASTPADAKSVAVQVALDNPPSNPPQNPPPPPAAPTLTVTSPRNGDVLVDPDGVVLLKIEGSVDTNGGPPVTVSFTVDGSGATSVPLTAANATTSTFSAETLVTGASAHQIDVSATNGQVPAPTQSRSFAVAARQPTRPLDRRLLLIEKLAITSLLGNFGASRVVKTFSLLPGESTTITVDSYTKTDETSKAASSILDSTAAECSADFEDTVNQENDSRVSASDQTNLGISADIGANWGWGHADIKGSYTTQANASRENTAKTVQNAVAKHASKASSNRTVNVNTEYTANVQQGLTTDTSRTLKNINVSRVLNVVFRQLTQQHIVVIHLVDATLGYYTRDALLDASLDVVRDANGNIVTQESYVEYTLPEINDFVAANLSDPANSTVPQDVLDVLGSIPDYQGAQRSLVELVVPNKPDGTPDAKAGYLRVVPNLAQTITVDDGGPTYTVPGIVLSTNTCVLRTDQLLCDALLGEGDALDEYSHKLQDVAIAERQAKIDAAAQATAREQLAQQIISTKDTDMAALWQKVFPPALSVPATITVPANEASLSG